MSESNTHNSSLGYIRRVCRYVWPHKRYLALSVVCAIGLAFSFSASVGSLLPLLKVMVEQEGLHGWYDREAAGERLGADLGIYNSLGVSKDARVPENCAQITAIDEDSPLIQYGINTGDFLVSVDESSPAADSQHNATADDALVIFHSIARAPPDTSLTMWFIRAAADRDEAYTRIDVQMRPLPTLYRLAGAMLTIVPHPPVTESAQQRMDYRIRTLIAMLVFMLILQILTHSFRFGAEYLAGVLSVRAIVDMRRAMYSHVLNLPLHYFAQRGVSDTMSRFMNDTQEVMRGLNSLFGKLIREPLKAIAVFTVAMMMQPEMTLIIVIAGPVAAVILRKFGKWIRRANKHLLESYSRMMSLLEGALLGMRVVKAYTMEHYERRQLWNIDRQVVDSQIKIQRIDAATTPVIETLGFILAMGIIIYAGTKIISGEIEPAELSALVIAFAAMLDPVRKLSNVYTRIQRANAAAQRIFELLDTPAEYDVKDGPAELPAPTRSIEFRNVSFTYPNAVEPAVRDVNFTVTPGQVVAVVGPNGSGKTTMVSMLPRFFDPDTGTIWFDDVDIRTARLRSLRKLISLVTQETVIFADTVAANIRYGRLDATDEQVQDAARRAFADEFITRMPEGYHTMVGEHGATLSGGQRQRIAIARAILRDAPILVFDEATSQVDADSERKIQQALARFMPGRTTFIIAHRFSTITRADTILVMDQGQLVDAGTHEQLMTRCDVYASLYRTQLHNPDKSDS